jgi:DNA invertase Pin-like site-specific DNA recombinase
MTETGQNMRIGYARTSTVEQKAGLEAQIRDLKADRVEKIFSEQLSSVDAKRVQLEAAIDYCREGDVLVCTKLDRLARSVADLVKIEERLKAKGASISIMDPAMDTSTPNGRLIFNVIASIAQFEREIMLTRQLEGIAKAHSEGKYKGRAPRAVVKTADVWALLDEGCKPGEVAERLGISERSVFRIQAKGRAAAPDEAAVRAMQQAWPSLAK